MMNGEFTISDLLLLHEAKVQFSDDEMQDFKYFACELMDCAKKWVNAFETRNERDELFPGALQQACEIAFYAKNIRDRILAKTLTTWNDAMRDVETAET